MKMIGKSILLVASFPDSLIKFRGSLIDAFLANDMVVHIAVPDLADQDKICTTLCDKGVKIHAIEMQRTGLNPLSDLGILLNLYRLMRSIQPDIMLCYTIKPVIYGCLAAWLAGVPKHYALITGLGYAFTGEGGKRTLVRALIWSVRFTTPTRSSLRSSFCSRLVLCAFASLVHFS